MTNPTASKFTGKKIILGTIVGAPVMIILGLYISYRINLRPVATTGAAQEFVVASGENAPKIGQRLVDAGLLRDRNAFVTYVNFHGLRPRLKVGRYQLAPTQSGAQIADILAGGRTITKRLVVPEGYTLAQIEAAAAAQGIPAADFKAALAAPHTQSFLATKPSDVDLEGYLFPDSYQIGADTTAAQLVNSMLGAFEQRIGTAYDADFKTQGLSLHEGLTLASIVERETNIAADRPIVAQIFLKRYRTGQSLGSDVTTEYAAKRLGVPFNINIDSKYNTRRYVGLPPGPICSPGLTAMDAVAHPANTDYLYFLSGKDGKTHFAKTYAEHQANIVKYL